MERFDVLNIRKHANNENVDIFFTGGYIQRYVSGTMFTQRTLQTPDYRHKQDRKIYVLRNIVASSELCCS